MFLRPVWRSGRPSDASAVSRPVAAGAKSAICRGACVSVLISPRRCRSDKTLHPVQLYESAADLLIFAILYRLVRNREHPAGQIIGLYLVLYSTARFIIEFYRVHEQALVGPFSLTQWIALALLATGIALLAYRRAIPASAQAQQQQLHA